jgi:molybdopterin-guanine dinucleotide biosynthesis protein A
MNFGRGKFSAAVLAGGRSSRMGADKAFLRIGDELLIERQLRCLADSGAEELLISGRVDVDYSPFPGNVICDEHSEAGPLAGIAAVLKAASCPLVLVLAVDMPAMIPEMLRKIVLRCTGNSGCVPADQERFQPLAAAYPTALEAMAERRLREGRRSMQQFVTEAMTKGFVQPLLIEPHEQGYFLNWNEPSDLVLEH